MNHQAPQNPIYRGPRRTDAFYWLSNVRSQELHMSGTKPGGSPRRQANMLDLLGDEPVRKAELFTVKTWAANIAAVKQAHNHSARE